ncbi:hypothetical protein A2442_03875 [Candidatus Campbellbacteria bacterium RIFOXYC2_FULL_35_25]|uniref:Uncharacterized protein n=1 Tax=Candidatus Campbellbacteria bacterium RIFOXYC2_FULL_35_25 TaxID=1797582 RepID=A0A1F5EK06_9BACT|nr:MAG: hypothetical protein A2442_03875 [Candidatus Campbellbacteria bacterium RIFOXYC2_FULL_35_25]
MKINKISIIVFALSLIIVGAGVTSAYGGLGTGKPELTDEQKATLEQMHDLRMSGDTEGAKVLAEEAGFPQMGFRGERRCQFTNEHREDAEEAVENNDYNAFLTAVVGSPMEDVITPEIFAKMVEAHSLREAGDIEGAREIMQGLGIGKGEGQKLWGERQGRGMGRGHWNK